MNSARKQRSWWYNPAAAVGVSFGFLLLTAALGTFLRYLFIDSPDGVVYKNFLHAHSHIGFLGWVYNALYGLILLYFIPKAKQKGMMRLFWLTQIATVGMLVFFPIQGYARESIMFSSLHIFFSWAFAAMSWKRIESKNATASRYLKLGLFFMVISSLGPLTMGPLMANGLGGTPWYYGAIYFYLHFQYNGWFLFALLALLYQYLDQRGMIIDKRAANRALLGFTLGCGLTLSLSIIWAAPYNWLYAFAGLGGLLQIMACYYGYRSLQPVRFSCWISLPPLVKQLLAFAALAFLFKNGLQGIAALPVMADMAFSIRNYIIAFLHLVFLGIVTPTLMAEIFRRGLLPVSLKARNLSYLFLASFVLSQLLLTMLYIPFFTPLLGPHYALCMFIVSGLMFLALAGMGVLKVRTPVAILRGSVQSKALA